MTTHQHKTGKLKLGDQEYSYEYWERDWNILGNNDLENKMYTSLHGTCHEMVVEAQWKVVFPDGKTLFASTVAASDSFEGCVKRLEEMYLLYEIAQGCGSLDQAREKWYEQLKR